jgi:hypothetical protein
MHKQVVATPRMNPPLTGQLQRGKRQEVTSESENQMSKTRAENLKRGDIFRLHVVAEVLSVLGGRRESRSAWHWKIKATEPSAVPSPAPDRTRWNLPMHGVLNGSVCAYDLVAMPLSNRWDMRLFLVYMQEREVKFSLVEAIPGDHRWPCRAGRFATRQERRATSKSSRSTMARRASCGKPPKTFVGATSVAPHFCF